MNKLTSGESGMQHNSVQSELIISFIQKSKIISSGHTVSILYLPVLIFSTLQEISTPG